MKNMRFLCLKEVQFSLVLGYLYNLWGHKRQTPQRRGSSAFVGEYSTTESVCTSLLSNA